MTHADFLTVKFLIFDVTSKIHSVYYHEMAPSTVSIAGRMVQDDDSKHYKIYR